MGGIAYLKVEYKTRRALASQKILPHIVYPILVLGVQKSPIWAPNLGCYREGNLIVIEKWDCCETGV